MVLRETAWHLQLWLRAFVRDRGWLEWWRLEVIPGADDLREVKYLKRFRRTMDRMDAKQCNHPKVQEKLATLRREADEAQQRFYKDGHRQKRTARGENNRRKLMEGRMSLCPYFWNVVCALLLYCLVVVPSRWFFRVVMPVAARTAAVLLMVGIVVGGAYYGYKHRGKVTKVYTAVKSDIVGMKSEWDYNQQQKRQVKVEALAWAQQHPDEVLRQKQLEQERKRREREENKRRSQAEWAAFWADVRNGLPGVGVFLLWVVGILIACVAVVGLLIVLLPKFMRGLGWLLWQPIRFLIWLLGLVFVPLWGATEPARSWWRRAWASVRQFFADTKTLIKAFLKAKKERVCPFLTVVPARE